MTSKEGHMMFEEDVRRKEEEYERN